MSGPKIGSFSFQRSPNLLAARRAQEGAETEEDAADAEDQEIPFAAHEIADVDQELRRRGKLGAEVLEDFAEDRHDFHDQEGGDGKGDADDDDRVGHGRLHLLAQAGARFEEAGQPVENLREQTAMLTGFHHADEEAIEHARMFRDRFVESFAALHAGGHVTDDVAQVLLPLRVALVVKRGQRLDERNTGFDHGRKLAGEEDEVGFFDRPGFLAGLAGRGLLLEGKNHQARGSSGWLRRCLR